MSLSQLATEDINLPAALLARLRSAAGAVYNHQLYFDSISCKAGQPPVNRLTEEIAASYGSMDRFRRLMTEAAESIIGSGWVWLVAEGARGIHLATTPNNEVVALASVTPLLVLDMWEHGVAVGHEGYVAVGEGGGLKGKILLHICSPSGLGSPVYERMAAAVLSVVQAAAVHRGLSRKVRPAST